MFLLNALASVLPTIGKVVLPSLLTLGANKLANSRLGGAIFNPQSQGYLNDVFKQTG
jgi:hypothetical protein